MANSLDVFRGTNGERRDLTERSRAACYFIEKHLWVADGQRFRLAPYQVDVLRDYYRGDLGGPQLCRRLVLSIAKKNGKTQLGAALAIVQLALPGHALRDEMAFTAAGGSKEQAGILFNAAAAMIRRTPALQKRFYIVDGQLKMVYEPTKSTLWALPVNARSTQGLNANLGWFFDELAQARNLDTYTALDLSQVRTDGGRGGGIVLSTNSTLPGNPLASLVDGVKARERAGEDVSDWSLHIYAGDPSLPNVFCDENIIAANPGLNSDPPILEMETLQKNRQEALPNPEKRQNFIAYRLNMDGGNTAPLVDISRWKSLALDEDEVIDVESTLTKTSRCFVGVDLSRSVDLSAICAFFPDAAEGFGYLLPMAWIPSGGVEAAEEVDKNPYRQWAEMGSMRLCEGDIIDAEDLAEYLIELMDLYDVREVRYDPAYTSQLKMAMRAKGYDLESEKMMEVFKAHRQGAITMTGSIADFERWVVEGTVRHPDNPVLNANILAASVKTSEKAGADWRTLVKASRSARIDCAVAAVMAMSGDVTAEGQKKRVIEPPSDFYSALAEASGDI